MIYTVKAHPTLYKGTMFRSRLEARYAAYFDLCGFKWEYEPVDLDGWTPDFKVTVPCTHSGCDGTGHEFWIEIKPYEHVSQFKGHAVERFNQYDNFPAVGLGLTPEVETETGFTHGSGGGTERLSAWVCRQHGTSSDIPVLWVEAGNITRYQPRQKAAQR